MKKFLVGLLLIVFLNSCARSFEQRFNKLVSIKEEDCLDIGSLEHSCNRDYKSLYLMGKEINPELLERAMSEKETKYRLCPMGFYLTEGDIAICLLLDINVIGDEEFVENLIPAHLIEKEKISGSIVWWDWIHESIDNRKWVVDKISSML